MKELKQHQQNKYGSIIATPIGKVGVIFTGNGVTKLDFLPDATPLIIPKSRQERCVVTKIKQYFCNPYTKFKLLLNISSTLLQKRIWRALQKIPVGTVKTYGELAKLLKTSPRVIGNACRLNPLPIIIPCHRVIAANGLGGYCGRDVKNIKIKKWLLVHESKNTII